MMGLIAAFSKAGAAIGTQVSFSKLPDDIRRTKLKLIGLHCNPELVRRGPFQG